MDHYPYHHRSILALLSPPPPSPFCLFHERRGRGGQFEERSDSRPRPGGASGLFITGSPSKNHPFFPSSLPSLKISKSFTPPFFFDCLFIIIWNITIINDIRVKLNSKIFINWKNVTLVSEITLSSSIHFFLFRLFVYNNLEY